MQREKFDYYYMLSPHVDSEAVFDVVIIGDGVIGNSIAYHLARQGRQVLMIDRSPIAETPLASWACAGGVRHDIFCKSNVRGHRV
jgi:glycine/D-amino acid oxidase-like deaminating enzyme